MAEHARKVHLCNYMCLYTHTHCLVLCNPKAVLGYAMYGVALNVELGACLSLPGCPTHGVALAATGDADLQQELPFSLPFL